MADQRLKPGTLADKRSELTAGLTSIRGSEKVYNEEDEGEDYWADIDVKRLRIRELRAALQARGLSTKGNKRALQVRLQQSVHEEKEEELEYLAMVEAARRAEAALEESGSVYTSGLNRKGQLGVGDRESRDTFTVVKRLRGKGIVKVSAGGDVALALAENGNVFTWGGVGTGGNMAKVKAAAEDGKLDARARRRKKQMEESGELEAVVGEIGDVGEDGLPEPRLIEPLQGEGIVTVSAGPNHCGAVSDGGDLYMWGDGTRGQCGTGRLAIENSPVLVEALQTGVVVTEVSVGQTHSMILLEDDSEVMSFGFSNSGKLGLTTLERKGVKPPANKYFPTPTPLPGFRAVKVLRVACSANHSAAITDHGLYTWGSGDGGRLGHGDHRDRFEPCRVDSLANEIVIDLSLGFWHTAAVVQVPPCYNGGWLFTWGSGYHGQLAQGDTTCCVTPTASRVCMDMRLLFVRVECGPTHCMALTIDNDLYSWGSNPHGELARELQYEEDEEREYSPIPGFVPGFNTIVDRVGRGSVISFACGRNFSVVATAKYVGETEEEVMLREDDEAAKMEREERRIERLRQKAAEEERRAAKTAQETIKTTDDGLVDLKQFEGMACVSCEACPGFEANLFHPNQCKECKHPRKYHIKPKKHAL
ncbi:RCC1 and BTB domain-containing protein 2 [Hondaea fermentalgiana]|uniref:RCC1 and BTB domain-containing protein 2 n=1 Tax=Hondaea fermentalgiana TaxID=2315210 RepID=A0A2R5G7J9_9STRA|nr:RCC1 and BTB domain-containing protein 2 [Hondaea fermentalgiana]|eukprot:GBG27017.1 RCC1 and BTB domain-containing protein 2 [Hondaea fermentalgiana]